MSATASSMRLQRSAHRQAAPTQSRSVLVRRRSAVVVAAAAGGSETAPALARRGALLALGAGVLLSAASPSLAVAPPTVCSDQATEEAADACRAAVLARDAGKQEDYATFEGRAARVAQGVPVAEMNDTYTVATLALADKMEQYFTLDIYDKARVPLIKAIKADAQAWVQQYARGGSVRKQSARRFYIACDAVLGFMASNGLAPFPASKTKTVRATIEEAKVLLAEGK